MTTRTAHAPAAHWATIGESTCTAGLWLLYQLHHWLGRWPFRLAVVPVVAWYWATQPRARAASHEFLAAVAARRGDPPPGRFAPMRHLLSFADTLLDKLLAMSGRYRFHQLQYEGHEPVQQMLNQRRGGMLVTAHVGCLELCQAGAQRRGDFKLTILVHTRHAEEFNRLLRKLSPDSGVELIQVTEITPATAALLAERVARGEFVAMAGDRVPVRPTPGSTAMVPFLGRSAPFPIGPYVLAMLLQCPLYFMACVREGTGHRVRFKRLAERVELPRARRAQALAEHAGGFAQALESVVVDAPFEWFNFFPFWDQPVTPQPVAAPAR
ncbi:MAG TPA: acyltransferase [Ideonella sp.]|uniref:LpxL/LpxP family acyltransferase n=1 Tax=Ideonella sp. TaxID=1929293 RepID=UPI002E310889|nr:acyltransferase [Ideonella sp.]HEX5686911.1 acyltransferase [Ideonella sp.]